VVQLYGLHGVIFQKMILFKTTAVKTSNPTGKIKFLISVKEGDILDTGKKLINVCVKIHAHLLTFI
jgi:hypothetical protein